MTTFDVIIAGAGTMGSAAAWALAKRGRRVLMLDRFAPPHDRGEHHGRQRVFRTAYFESPKYVTLAQRAGALWRELERERGVGLLDMVGCRYLGPPGSVIIEGVRLAARTHGLACDACASPSPFTAPPDYVCLHEHDAGFVRCEVAVAAMIECARAGGANVRTDESVESWSADDHSVRVHTHAGSYAGGALVLACGPWAAGAMGDVGIPLRVTRQVQAWARPSCAPSRLPTTCWLIDMGDGRCLYGLPFDPATGTMKFAWHVKGPPVSDAELDQPAAPATTAEIADLRAGLLATLPQAAGEIEATVCRYTNSPDDHFIIDRHPRHANVAVACGFSGHGFKFAPAVGELLADLVERPIEPPAYDVFTLAARRRAALGGTHA